jgi:site-specific recombinase XerD
MDNRTGSLAVRDTFREAMLAEGELHEQSVESYGVDVGQFLVFLDDRGVALDEIGLDDVEAFLASVDRNGAAVSTRRRKQSGIRKFIRWASCRGLAPAVPLPVWRCGRPLKSRKEHNR